MRRTLIVALSTLLAAQAFASAASAQVRSGSGRGGQQQQGEDDAAAAAKKKRDSEWNQPQAPLRQLRNAGPCPYVKVLYDASRYVDFKDAREAANAVAYTGEFQSLSSGCSYKDEEPISVRIEMLMGFGKGPQATGNQHTYRYWVAVTQRNQQVLAKEYFDVPVTFKPGEDRALVTETIEELVIPRAKVTVSGSNFEVLVGFDVTPQMAAFNRDGKRFRVNTAAVTAPGAPAAQ
ncbi:MAG: Tat pathway signal sequence domain protein [Caulobacterales bacterium 68-7]|nr:Tat pathway signal sequence domain protein [Caulobacterales bacterium]OJU07734.1 MAG: Tat pathway signal sequence domain protein [Caulobacterales bacterium 68-7]